MTTVSDDDLRFTQLVQKIAPGGRLLRRWSLMGGISAQTDALEVAYADGAIRKLVVRRASARMLAYNRHGIRDEFRLLQMTHTLGLATPAAYLLDESGEIFPGPYLVMEYIEGAPKFVTDDVVDYAQQAAAHLAQIHRCASVELDLAFLPRTALALSEYDAIRVAAFDPSLAVSRLCDTLAAVWPLAPCNAPRLLHGDFWPGNLLWRAGRLVAVIDWEDAHVGDPFYDLAISRLDLLCIFGVEAMHVFTRHYQAALALDDRHLPYRDLYAALRLVRMAEGDFAGWAAFYPPVGRPDITAQSLHAHYTYFITQSLDRLS